MYQVRFTKKAFRSLEVLESRDEKKYLKISKILESLTIDPYHTNFKQEKLSNMRLSIDVYSCRINKKDRLVYIVYDDSYVLILQCLGHDYDQEFYSHELTCFLNSLSR